MVEGDDAIGSGLYVLVVFELRQEDYWTCQCCLLQGGSGSATGPDLRARFTTRELVSGQIYVGSSTGEGISFSSSTYCIREPA